MQVIGLVDVGFVRASIARTCASDGARVRVNAEAVAGLVQQVASSYGASSALRTYWYDGQYDPQDARFSSQRRYLDAVGSVPGVQVRAGQLVERTPGWHETLLAALTHVGVSPREFAQHFSMSPELVQKGVDTLMVLDLVLLAQRRAYDVAVLLAGDADLTEAVRVAQQYGAKVVLARVPGHRVALSLRLLADDVVDISPGQMAGLSLRSRPTTS